MGTRIHDIFGPGSNIDGRIIKDYAMIADIVGCCKGLQLKIVLTSGTFDLFHVGHSRYLEEAKRRGDVLIVGIDSDVKVRKTKGVNRPIVPEDERMEILCHCRHVDVVFLKGENDPKWQLIKTIKPDTLIATKATYNEEQIVELRQYCGQVIVFEPQATTSTTAKVRRIMLGPAAKIKEKLEASYSEMKEFLENLTKDGAKEGGE